MELTELLFSRRDEAYAAFQHRITPNIPAESIIGVRVPVLRGIAKDFVRTPECSAFLDALPHRCYEENMLHSILLTEERDLALSLSRVEAFLPFIDNWAVCDTLSPKCWAKHRRELTAKFAEWAASPLEYTCRFGIGMLMRHGLDGDFDPALLEIPAGIRREEYYVRMMQAWFYATALAKQWDAALPYLTEKRLDLWVHNRTIRKALESFRVPEEHKALLKTLRR